MYSMELILMATLLILCVAAELLECFVNHKLVFILKPIIFIATLFMLPSVMGFLFSILDVGAVLEFTYWVKEILANSII